ncbi:Oidioi.mRNA.OKI2018_I69.PAR.g9170.t1.cds [Oikopleura dioica]|uniref:Oidioi.mRNA.OKI2018_I69.PAR.g9170.t1.cds n=1 Tax=Oikopleura dioica TaxID=34765 RepID=A0ABN7RNR1_OIKDI|nr:Oidioi.mRNA.OKI2018_I69.PAR.g9170.t1.cds [Oikopleura dioica]
MGGTSSNLPQLSTTEVTSKLQDPKYLFIDVRGASELAGGKLEAKRFLNIPHTQIAAEFKRSEEEFKSAYMMDKPSKDAHIIIYCQRGRRGGMAQDAMAELGYENVYNWENGYSSL